MSNPQNNFIELVTVVFEAGESRLFAVSGQYFELIDAPSPLDVLLTDTYGAQRGIMRGAEASFNLKNTDFATVQITSATAQTIRFAYGSGEAGTRRAAGSVNIANVPSVALQLADVNLLRRPESPASIWTDNTAQTANVPKQVIAPASNPNGILLIGASANESHSAFFSTAFVAKSSAPASIVDGDVLMVCASNNSQSSNWTSGFSNLPAPIFVPAGLGVYYISGLTIAGTTTGIRSARWLSL